MPNYSLKKEHQELLSRFQSRLRILGYSRSSWNKPACGVVQFLEQIEAQGLVLRQLGPEHIKSYYGYLLQKPGRKGTLSPVTIDGYLYTLRLFFSFLLQEGIVATHPMATLRFPAKRHQRERLSAKLKRGSCGHCARAIRSSRYWGFFIAVA